MIEDMHNEDLQSFLNFPNIIRVTISRRMRRLGM
jgi:hypothetical protein